MPVETRSRARTRSQATPAVESQPQPVQRPPAPVSLQPNATEVLVTLSDNGEGGRVRLKRNGRPDQVLETEPRFRYRTPSAQIIIPPTTPPKIQPRQPGTSKPISRSDSFILAEDEVAGAIAAAKSKGRNLVEEFLERRYKENNSPPCGTPPNTTQGPGMTLGSPFQSRSPPPRGHKTYDPCSSLESDDGAPPPRPRPLGPCGTLLVRPTGHPRV